MIVTENTYLQGKSIVKELGHIEAMADAFSGNMWKNAKEKLIKQAEEMGANAIIEYRVQDVFGFHILFKIFRAKASGTAVIYRDYY